MNDSLFEQLLYEEESPSLDFKREQYRFAKASDEEKSELLKDLLGFANTWRRSEAFILIGVEDVRGGRADVVGVASHLDDHSLQQFVNNLTNRPLRFHYEALGFEGKQLGVIRIEQQPRPLYLKRDFGKLKRNEVYVRRGTSTDPTKPATPEEISQMGTAGAPQTAEVEVGFADIDRDTGLGTSLSWQGEYCEMPDEKTIPDLKVNPTSTNTPSWLLISYEVNPSYYRELARYEFARRLFRPVRLIVTNGQVAANSVRIELIISTSDGTQVRYQSDMPQQPQRYYERFAVRSFPHILPTFSDTPGHVVIGRNDERIKIEIECGNLQPGRSVWSEVFLVGVRKSGEMAIPGRLFAGNLPRPHDFTLRVAATIVTSKLAVEDLKALRHSPKRSE